MGRIMIWVCAYRDWSINIFDQIQNQFECKLITSQDKLIEEKSKFKKSDKIFFLGWSWIISDDIINNFECICLHPSPLPKYRGGSPIQHQIINNEKYSAVTFFKMNNKLDAGDILWQQFFSLKGELVDVFNRIENLGVSGIIYILLNDPKSIPQNDLESTYYKRRQPKESEITINDLKNNLSYDLYNKIRSLQDPYPNAYIKCKNGTKLYIKQTSYENKFNTTWKK
jgi:methionyl-tRNA formyltransferase|tara:strand:+ start:12095 stop:12772 length:678 start_codon:yes stop_codon:yes gene_type:complete